MTTLHATLSASAPSGSAKPDAGRVTLSRTDGRDVQHRQIYARIDGGASHTLLFGDVVTVELTPGTHRLQANNTLFWKRVTFTLEPGQHVEFSLVNGSGKLAFGFLALLGAAPLTLSIEERQRQPSD